FQSLQAQALSYPCGVPGFQHWHQAFLYRGVPLAGVGKITASSNLELHRNTSTAAASAVIAVVLFSCSARTAADVCLQITRAGEKLHPREGQDSPCGGISTP
ncbi:unnamed protein product, partial [Laminaria digitata]